MIKFIRKSKIDNVIQNIGEKVDEMGKQTETTSFSSSSKTPFVLTTTETVSQSSSVNQKVEMNSKAFSGNIPFVEGTGRTSNKGKESSSTKGNFLSADDGGTPSASTLGTKKDMEKDGFLMCVLA